MTRTSLVALCAVPVATAVAITAAGCSGYKDARGRGDAPVQQVTKPTWQVIPAPDEYGNLASICNPVQKGTRIYIVTHSKTDVTPVIYPDEACR